METGRFSRRLYLRYIFVGNKQEKRSQEEAPSSFNGSEKQEQQKRQGTQLEDKEEEEELREGARTQHIRKVPKK
jgi:hypothetical protein